MRDPQKLQFLIGATIENVETKDGRLVLWVHDLNGVTGCITGPLPFEIVELKNDEVKK